MKDSTKKWAMIATILLVLAVFGGQKESKKTASAGLSAARTFSAGTVAPGASIVATYSPESPNYFGLIEDVPVGWTPSKTVSPDGRVRTAADGDPITITWTAPATTGSYVFGGEYFVNPDTEYTNFPTDTIDVCTSQDYSACVGTDRYWYTSCDDLQTLREGCVQTPCESYGANFCTSLTIEHTRTCYTLGCSADTCTNTPYDDTETVTSAPNSASGICAWSCTNGACDQNTAGDTNFDGCVSDPEFPVAVDNWKQQTGGVTDIEFPSIVDSWKNMINCI